MKHKALQAKITDAEQGKVRAVFATLNVVDSDGDVTLPGAFGEQEVRISAYNHASWHPGQLPVGKGRIFEEGEEAIFEGQFFLSTSVGRDTFEVVKQLGELGEWSYGFDVLESEPGQWDGQSVQLLRKIKVHEVSPVILGAGVNTRTLEAKAAKVLDSDLQRMLAEAGVARWGSDEVRVFLDDVEIDEGWAVFALYAEDEPARHVRVTYELTDGGVTLGDDEEEVEPVRRYEPKAANQKLFEQIASVVADVEALTDRVADVVAMRARKGKSLGVDSAESLSRLVESLSRLQPAQKRLEQLLEPRDDELAAAVEREWLRDLRRRVLYQ